MTLSIYSLAILFTFFAYSRQYELGSSYIFNYETSLVLNEPKIQRTSATKDVGFKTELIVRLTPVWQHPTKSAEQILQLEVSKHRLMVKSRDNPTSEFVEKSSKALTTGPFYLHRNGGKVQKVFFNHDDDLAVTNIKKGIASLFQYQTTEGTGHEIDSSGSCQVAYKQTSPQELIKIKTHCHSLHVPEFYNHTNKVMAANVDSEVVTTYQLDPKESYIRKASTFETHFLRPEVRKNIGAEILSTQSLTFKDKVHSSRNLAGNSASEVLEYISRELRKSLASEPLNTQVEPRECIACKSLTDLIRNFRAALSAKNLGTQSSAVAFLRLLRKFRESDFEVLVSTIENKNNIAILPQILDIAAAAQTLPSHKAAMSVLNFKGSLDLPERYLQALSVATHPLPQIIQDLLIVAQNKLPNDKLYETLVLSLAAMTHTLSKTEPGAKIHAEMRHFLMESSSKCSNELCELIYMRALKNLRDAATVRALLDYAAGSAHKTAVAAMRALQTMPQHYLQDKAFDALERIFLQLDGLHDWSVRAMCLQMLLKNRSSEKLLQDVFRILQHDKSREFNTLVLGQTLDISESDHKLREMLRPFLNDTRHSNYHTLGQGGMSAMYSRTLVEDKEASASFSSVLEVNSGILKRSTVDVIIASQQSQLRLLSFGVFAGGLSMFGGGGEADDGEEANAGIEITLMDSQLRPFVFFTGQGELMGHVWSGTASQRTTALQGAVLLQDHSQYVALQNGFNINLLMTGVVSYDMAGKAEVSLWNKNAHSVVEVGAALIVQGQARLDSSYIQTMIEFNVGTQAQLNFITDLDFSGEIQMCLQMVQPTSQIIDSVRKLERIPESNYALRKYKRRVTPIAGKTYAVNRKNTQTCSKMFT